VVGRRATVKERWHQGESVFDWALAHLSQGDRERRRLIALGTSGDLRDRSSLPGATVGEVLWRKE
jgi:hypothetical protein